MADDETNFDSEEKIVNTTEKVQFGVDITRGTGTRDQEKYKLRATGETAEDALAEFERLADALYSEYGDQLRSFDPDDDWDEDDDIGEFDEFDG